MDHGVDLALENLIEIPRRGTVVVGTVVAGEITVGDVVEFRGVVARCAGIEKGRQLLPRATIGDRLGVLLDGACLADLAATS